LQKGGFKRRIGNTRFITLTELHWGPLLFETNKALLLGKEKIGERKVGILKFRLFSTMGKKGEDSYLFNPRGGSGELGFQ